MKTSNTEKITLMLPEKLQPSLDYAAELSSVPCVQVVNLLLEKVYFQVFSRGEIKTKVRISEDHDDYVFYRAAKEGLSPEDVVNKAVKYMIDLHDSPINEEYCIGDDVPEFYGWPSDEEKLSFQEELESSWKKASLDGENLVPVEAELSHDAKEILLEAASLGIRPNYLVNRLFNMYLLEFWHGEQEKEVEVTISAENVEYLQRCVLHGMTWRDTINLGIEFLHKNAVDEAKEKGLPLTEKEMDLESIDWQ